MWVETCWVLQSPGDFAFLPQPPFQCTRGQGVPRMWPPICPPPVSTAHASACSQTSKNVKHVDARSGVGGMGEMLITRRPLGLDLALSFAGLYCTQSHPHHRPTRRKGNREGSAPPPLPSLEAVKGAAKRAPAGLGGEPLAKGPADFLLISSRKLAPCASLRTALGRGDPRRVRPPRRGAGEGHPGSGGERGRRASWAGSSPWLSTETLS